MLTGRSEADEGVDRIAFADPAFVLSGLDDADLLPRRFALRAGGQGAGLWIVATFSSTNAFLERIRLGESVEEDATHDGSVLRSQVASA